MLWVRVWHKVWQHDTRPCYCRGALHVRGWGQTLKVTWISFPIKLRDISQCLPLPGVILHSTALGGGWGRGGGEQHMTKQLNVSSHHINIYLYTIKQQQQNKLRLNVESYNIPQTQTLTTPNTTGHWTSNSSLCTQLYPSQHYNNDNNKISPFLFILVSLSCTNVNKISVQTRS